MRKVTKRPTQAELFSLSVADCTLTVESLPPEQPPLAVTLERSIDFLRSKAADRLAAELEADPDKPVVLPCQACERPEFGIGATRNPCPAHKEILDEYTLRNWEYQTRCLKADCPTGMAAEGGELAREYSAKMRAVGKAKEAAA